MPDAAIAQNGASSVDLTPRSVTDLIEARYGRRYARYTRETVTTLAAGTTKVLSRDRMRIRVEFSVVDPAANLYMRRDPTVSNQNGVELTRLGTYTLDWKDDFDEPADEFWCNASAAIILYIREVLLQHV